jgi:predicted Ser/Thr protein kinase
MDELLPTDPAKLGGWTLQGRLGSGGMGVVYMGNQKGKTAAIKVIHASSLENPRVKSRFKQEVRSLELLDNPYVAPLIEANLEVKNPWYAVEYISAMSLNDVVKTAGSFTGKHWWHLAQHLLLALNAIHQVNVIHRDLKPANVMISNGIPKLIDFGLAKPITEGGERTHSTFTGQWMGTPQFMSPEQWENTKDVDGKTDIWALGITLISAAGGQAWGSRNSNDIQALLHLKRSPDSSALNIAQKELVSKMLIHDSSKRWSATQLLKNFDTFYNHLDSPAAAQVKVEAKPIIAPRRNNQARANNIRVQGNRVVVEGSPMYNREDAKIRVEGNRVVVGEDAKPPAPKVAKNPYVTSDGVPIFIGMRVKYIKTDELGRVTKLDKNDTGYVYVQLDGQNESKVKSTNQLVSAAGIRKEKSNNFEPSFIRRNWKDLLFFWLLTPPIWLIFKYFNDEDFRAKYFATNTTQGLKYWKIGFLVTHIFTFGVLGPVVSVPLAIKQKKLLVSVFAVINTIGVWVFLIGISNTPDGGTLPAFPTIMFIVNYLGGFFLPLVLRIGPKSPPSP